MSVGVLAHLFGRMPYKELAHTVGLHGFKHVQLALWKAIDDVDFSEAGRLSPGLARNIAEEFHKNDVSISILGCYVHLFDRNEEKRRRNVARFKELIVYARCFGATTVAAETGKLPLNDFSKQDRAALRASLEELIEEAEKWGIFIGLEPANDHLIGTAPALKQMLDEVPSSHLGVVLDPGNLITLENIHHQDQVIEEAFTLLGKRVVGAHAKDRMLMEDGAIQTVTPGKGQLNYLLFLTLLHQYKPQCDIILEATKPEQMKETKVYVERLQQQVREAGMLKN
ncbi:sugar phosphate isomerase/epimerase family protein [Jeotgalibacillus soli]|uniref:Sugar phosphate isomerase n=1 Tax=Jeotgalibacillus soli TaxID=889306 RepID=A0A0C2W7Z6_9BACL|nr:sugar phosphate isomerase/epimerase [Jeotgalibacillus soli]KIL52148.1 sugar phosphate isomerase [Jeotgalibacillus soli]